MSLIQIQNLTFQYDTSHENIFEDVSLSLDTDWRLGFVGRNGRGKTTFLNLLLGRYRYSGSIQASVSFDYFPFPIEDESMIALRVLKEAVAPFERWEREMEEALEQGDIDRYGQLQERYLAQDGYQIEELLAREVSRLSVDPEVLERPFCTLSGGERTKCCLAALFLKKERFLLIDEPTNHLDSEGRRVVANYLSGKRGFILVSHDRALLDGSVDHILSLNRRSIELQRGNYQSFRENRRRQDEYELARDEALRREIDRLSAAAKGTASWSNALEKTKYGHYNSGLKVDRGYIGHKSAKMMKRAKVIEARQQRQIEEKESLLQDLEESEELALSPLRYPSQRLLEARELSVGYGSQPLFTGLNFTLGRGERIALCGRNGCGKSSVLRLLLGEAVPHTGVLQPGSGLVVSYVPQDTSFLRGSLRGYARDEGVDESLFLAILRKLGFSRTQFQKELSCYSEGQKKKVLLARSLCQRAHLYVWDEPLNYLDIPSREQIEELLGRYQPAMLLVEHDERFLENIGARRVPVGE